MNNTTKSKILISIISILLITNVVMMIFYFKKDNRPPEQSHKPGFTERLKKEVKFDSTQMAIFDKKKKAHWDRMRSLFDEITTTKEHFYQLVYDTALTDSLLESKAVVIGERQKELDLQVFRYFKDVRRLCRPGQLASYDSLLPAIVKRMTELPGKK